MKTKIPYQTECIIFVSSVLCQCEFCIGMIVLLVAVWNSGGTLTETKRRVKMACILLTLIIYGMCIGVEAVQIGVKYVALFILFSIYVLLDCFRLRSKKQMEYWVRF